MTPAERQIEYIAVRGVSALIYARRIFTYDAIIKVDVQT